MGRLYKRWSKGEEDYLRENYGVVRTKDIAISLGRPVSSVQAKANRLGLRMDDYEYEGVTGKVRWNREDIEYIEENYGKESADEIAKKLGKSRDMVQKYAGLLGVTRNYHVWSRKEEEYLRENWGERSLKDIADDLGLDMELVRQKGYSLGLRKQEICGGNYLTPKDVSEILGSSTRVVYDWIYGGYLKHRKFSVGKVFRYQISVDNFKKFLKDHRDKYNTKKSDLLVIKSYFKNYRVRDGKVILVDRTPKWLNEKILKDMRYKKRDPKVWTLKEIRYLKELRGMGLGYNEIGEKLGRSYNSVYHKVRKLERV